jgi:hypothetical protein
MVPINFPEANIIYRAPDGLDESQVGAVHGWAGEITGSNMDGAISSVIAWQPSEDDIKKIVQGQPIFITMIGGCAPHLLSMSFHEATNL